MEPPKMLFLTVRNQIDISYNISLEKVFKWPFLIYKLLKYL
jgi:hypothetical protein